MEGLEEINSPLRPSHHFRTLSLNVPPIYSDDDSPKQEFSDSAESEFDPDVIAAFRRALQDVPPASPFPPNPKRDKVIVYFTSLRGVRKTYEDCCQVLAILKAIGVRIDERDVSMHSGFKEELKDLLRDCGGYGSRLPRVFIGNRHVGGWEEIRRMNEEGGLAQMFEGCQRDEDDDKFCDVCGNIRFIPCQKCSGSCKILYEEDEEEMYDEEDHGFHRCPDCNENGLLRCPHCCD